MKLRELTEKYLNDIDSMSSLDEIVKYTTNKKIELADKLNKNGHDIDVSLDNISNKNRYFREDDINDWHFLLDLERIDHGLQGRWITDLDNQKYSNELQKRVNEIVVSKN